MKKLYSDGGDELKMAVETIARIFGSDIQQCQVSGGLVYKVYIFTWLALLNSNTFEVAWKPRQTPMPEGWIRAD